MAPFNSRQIRGCFSTILVNPLNSPQICLLKFSNATMIGSVDSSRVSTIVSNAEFLIVLHRYKLTGLRSGDRAVQPTSQRRPIASSGPSYPSHFSSSRLEIGQVGLHIPYLLKGGLLYLAI